MTKVYIIQYTHRRATICSKLCFFQTKYRVCRFAGTDRLIFSVILKKRIIKRFLGGEESLSDDEIISGFVSELRRGTVVLGVLNQLSTPKYGYSLGQELTEKGVPVDGNTLYPLLRRLENQGLLQSEWDMSEGKPRKYYVRTAKGTKINEKLRDYWIETVVNISTLMKGEQQ